MVTRQTCQFVVQQARLDARHTHGLQETCDTSAMPNRRSVMTTMFGPFPRSKIPQIGEIQTDGRIGSGAWGQECAPCTAAESPGEARST
ncbi:MAG TPA: hypothetical protein DDY91_23855, partial [Planctomycetaceae bacterium]|nr:hypothetical protein [Planctomycetaceae bacterium]